MEKVSQIKMKKYSSLFLPVIALGLLIVFIFSFNRLINKGVKERGVVIKHEERPDQPAMNAEEAAMFQDYVLERQKQIRLKSAPVWGQSSYANGKLQGTWSPKISHTGWYGYRVDNSAYDSLRNVFYVVSYAGHIYKLEYENGVKWTLLNHKVVLNPSNNSSANPVFMGTLMSDSTFRLIRSHDELNIMEYSDDEGRTWHTANGAQVTQSWSNQAFEITINGQRRIVLHTYHDGYHHVYFSDDYGENYIASQYSFPISNSDMRIAKPYFTNEAYMWVWSKTNKEVDIYKYSSTAKDFELKHHSPSNLVGTNLSSVAATYVNGSYHFYMATINSDYTVYYSSDEGQTWEQKNAGRDRAFEVMCPNKPNILISGFEDMKQSTDYGTNWTGYGYKLGWDLQHMRTYEKSDGNTITLAGLDFGCYISETPEDKESYIWCNNGAWYGMHYDAASSENFNSIYMANQDRGSTAYLDSSNNVNTVDVDGTDVLRVCFANHETSVWTWFYYGRIKHRYNFPTGQPGEASYDGLGNWWAAPIIASPNPAEDAIYAAYGSNLQKFTYNPETSTINTSSHPFNFKTKFGYEIGGFGYSELNRNLWYVALSNGYFVYSYDGGTTWERSTYSGSKPSANDQTYNYAKNQIVIKTSQIDTNKVYYAGVGNYFLVSINGGKSFVNKNNGLDIYRIRDFTLSPDEKFVFAACGFGGAWVYSVDDDMWYQMSDDPVPSVDFTDVQFINKKNTVRFSSFGSGILDFVLAHDFNALLAPGGLSAALNVQNQIALKWKDQSDNESGYYIEKAVNAGFERIDTLVANSLSYTDTNVYYGQKCYYRVKAFNDTAVSFASNLVYVSVPKKGFLNPAGWTIIDFSSEEVNGEYAPVKYAIDNNPSTFWHTQWDGAMPTHPHHITIDLGTETEIAGFRYLPRQDGNLNGSISGYEFYISNDTLNWGSAMLSGEFEQSSNWKETMLDIPAKGRYIKMVALSEINGNAYLSVAEIAVLYEAVIPETPSNLSSVVINDFDIRLAWKDNSVNELGFIIEQWVEGVFIAIDTVGASVNSYLLSDLLPATTYAYQIRAYNMAGITAPSDQVEAITKDPLWIFSDKVGFEVFPNPCSEHLNIKLDPFNFKAQIRLFDLQGKTIKMMEVGPEVTDLHFAVQDISDGYYMLAVEIDGKKSVRKIYKQK